MLARNRSRRARKHRIPSRETRAHAVGPNAQFLVARGVFDFWVLFNPFFENFANHQQHSLVVAGSISKRFGSIFNGLLVVFVGAFGHAVKQLCACQQFHVHVLRVADFQHHFVLPRSQMIDPCLQSIAVKPLLFNGELTTPSVVVDGRERSRLPLRLGFVLIK